MAFDLTPAVEIAYENTHDLPQVHIIQADIHHLPLKSKFDYIYSNCFLQHLPDSEMAFLNLVKLLNEGGYLSIWVYRYEGTGPVRWVIDTIRRLIQECLFPWFISPVFCEQLLSFF